MTIEDKFGFYSIELIRILNKPYKSNCFVIDVNKRAIIIDPGDFNIEILSDFLKGKDLIVDYIILTHEHFDHIMGVNKIKNMYDCKIVALKACSEKIITPEGNLSKYNDIQDFSVYPADILIEDIDNKIFWQDVEIQFYHTPGHSPGSMCISIGNSLFTGDTLIKGIKTYTRLPNGDRDKAKKSIEFIFQHFPVNTRIFPGHGEDFSLSEVIDNKFYVRL